MKWILVFNFFILSFLSFSQNFSWTPLDTMPFRTANNAVVEAQVGDTTYVLSFGGIDTSKSHDGIHQKAMRYNVQSGVWSFIPDLPDTLGKIASGASLVNGIVYIMGGYHVLANGNELSSDRVHRYDPSSNTYLTDGTPIPVPIDDHVQCVYKDSLIYLVTGWSNNGNKPDVQIYNPATDSWQVGTSTPFSNQYVAFGASGDIVGNKIYYNGGAAGSFSFTNRPYLRVGEIDPLDPTLITWSYPDDNPGDAGYRMASMTYEDKIFWVGGAPTAYNYNGIAYNGSGGVDPMSRILMYDTDGLWWDEGIGQAYAQMDLRGVAKVASNKWIICGGMEVNQVVSNRTFLFEFDTTVQSLSHPTESTWKFENPLSRSRQIPNSISKVTIFDLKGSIISTPESYLSPDLLSKGIYILCYEENGIPYLRKLVIE
jgi:hypothetical protein